MAFWKAKDDAADIGALGALLVLFGLLLSGPAAMALVALIHPQPPWEDAALFSLSYHRVQEIPYFLGLVLVPGFVLLAAALHAMADRRHLAGSSAGLAFSTSGAALIFLNYILQTTFVSYLARHFEPQNASLISALTMANPASLAWGLEMWGYGLIGLGCLLVAPAFAQNPAGRRARAGFYFNGTFSLAGALMTAAWPGWVMRGPGLAAFAAWNGLAAFTAAFAFLSFRQAGGGKGLLGKRA